MAPKPKSATSPKKPKKKDTEVSSVSAAQETSDSNEPPKTKEEALAQISFEGLPSCATEEVVAVMRDKYDTIAKVFAHYCKFSECKTVEMATRMRLSGFKRLVKESGLEVKVYNIDQMSRLFNLKGGAKGAALDAEDGTSLGIEQFLTLLVHLAFYRDNPRYAPQLTGAPKLTQETVPVLQTVNNMIGQFLPKMRKGDQAEFRMVLKGDTEAQGVLASYAEKIGGLLSSMQERAEKLSSDVYTQMQVILEETGSLGIKTLDVTETSGITVTHKSSLSELQCRHSFLDTQVRAARRTHAHTHAHTGAARGPPAARCRPRAHPRAREPRRGRSASPHAERRAPLSPDRHRTLWCWRWASPTTRSRRCPRPSRGAVTRSTRRSWT